MCMPGSGNGDGLLFSRAVSFLLVRIGRKEIADIEGQVAARQRLVNIDIVRIPVVEDAGRKFIIKRPVQ